jgi:glycosyltransferase involved in cell wall biosynthesis
MKSKLPRVNVVMATYNGAKYLEEQLESIKNQIEVEIEILVVDDGSTDTTLQILEKYKGNGLVSQILYTDRVGPSAAFNIGLNHVSKAEWVCFSDQDDIWCPEKITKAIQVATSDSPILVSGARTYVSEFNHNLGKSIKLRRSPHWKNALVENICFGNTILINQSGVSLLGKYRHLEPVIFDAWLYLVFALQGEIIYQADSGTRYRLHSSNHVGVGRNWHFALFVKNQRDLIHNALLLAKSNQQYLDKDFIRVIHRFEKCLSRGVIKNWNSPFYLSFFRQRILDNIVLRLLSPWVFKKSNL